MAVTNNDLVWVLQNIGDLSFELWSFCLKQTLGSVSKKWRQNSKIFSFYYHVASLSYRFKSIYKLVFAICVYVRPTTPKRLGVGR